MKYYIIKALTNIFPICSEKRNLVFLVWMHTFFRYKMSCFSKCCLGVVCNLIDIYQSHCSTLT